MCQLKRAVDTFGHGIWNFLVFSENDSEVAGFLTCGSIAWTESILETLQPNDRTETIDLCHPEFYARGFAEKHGP